MTWQDPYGQYGQHGQNPYGQDPYGQQGRQHTQPGWQDPYAQQNAYGQQQGYGYYGPPGAPARGSNGSTVAALVCNIIAALFCCVGIAWLPGIILAAMAMNRNNTDPESAKQLTLWSWVCVVLNIVLVIVLLVVLFGIGTFTDHSSGTSSTY